MIVPGSARLAFNMALEFTQDENRTVMHNIGRAIVKKISIKIEGNEVHSLDDADVYNCFKELSLIKRQLENLAYRGIESDNVTYGEKDKDIADTYGNRLYVPLDFEPLTDHSPFYQARLADRLSYKLMFNNYSKVVTSTDADAKYRVGGISLEYEVVTNAELARIIKNQYSGKMMVLYTTESGDI